MFLNVKKLRIPFLDLRIPPEFLPNSSRIPFERLPDFSATQTLQFCILEYAAGREGHVVERPLCHHGVLRGFSSCRTPEAFTKYSHGTDEFQVGFDMV